MTDDHNLAGPEQHVFIVLLGSGVQQDLCSRIHKMAIEAGCRWLIPVILATQEAEVRRIAV
jgi:hypothetical protein